MPFAVSHPSDSSTTTGSTGQNQGLGRVHKRHRRRSHATGYVQYHRGHYQQHHRHPHPHPRRKQRSLASQRASSLGDIISGFVHQRYPKSNLQKKPPGTKSRPPTRSATTLELSKLQKESNSIRRNTVAASSAYVLYSEHRVSSVSASGNIGGGVIACGICESAQTSSSNKLRGQHAIAESEPILQCPSSPRLEADELIDQRDQLMPIPATAAVQAARVAFGLLGSSSRSSAVSRTYAHMADTSTPSVFLTGLSSQCVHTLYAGSFVIYLTNLVADWLHTYYACKGWSVTFALKPWLTIWMICCCAAGGVCNFLLLYLCIENALRRKWDAEQFRGGCRLICQRFCNWITDFDCFRISFLILVLENAPMTFINYWFVSSCSIPRQGKVGWTFAFACGTTILSILWRGLMTFLAYKNLRCIRRPAHHTSRSGSKRSTASASAYLPLQQTPAQGATMTIGEMQHQRLEAKISGSSSASTMDELRSLASGDYTNHYDECWPVRMSCWIMYNQRDDAEPDSSVGGTNSEGLGKSASRHGFGANLPPVQPPDNCLGYCCQASCCVCLCIVFYTGMFLSGCAPCAYHYTCRRNSRMHRHKFARTCTRGCSLVFNISMVIMTIFLVISLLVMNLIWLSSVHVIGNNRTPPEISQICLVVQPELRSVHPTLMTTIIPQPKEQPKRPPKRLINCKPLFELNDQWGFWWQRSVPGPWLYQGTFVDDMGWPLGSTTDQMAIMTEARIGCQADEMTKIYAQFVHGIDQGCQYRVYDNWTIVYEQPLVPLPWPYWTACDMTYMVEERVGGCQRTQLA